MEKDNRIARTRLDDAEGDSGGERDVAFVPGSGHVLGLTAEAGGRRSGAGSPAEFTG